MASLFGYAPTADLIAAQEAAEEIEGKSAEERAAAVLKFLTEILWLTDDMVCLRTHSDEGGEFDIQVIPAGQIHVCENVTVFVQKERWQDDPTWPQCSCWWRRREELQAA